MISIFDCIHNRSNSERVIILYKVFAYIGSYRGNQSSSVHITKELLKYLSAELDTPIDFKLYTPSDIQLNECVGCTNCFINGSCSIDDDIDIIKEEMLKSDIIIFASPVYFQQVSGCMKTFIDRISYWAHTLELRGRVGISINVSDTNGNHFVEEYLNKVMSFLGMCVIQNISIQTATITGSEAFESIIRVWGNKIVSALKSKRFPLSSIQEIYFQNMKASVIAKTDDTFEKMYWKQNNLFNYASFHDMFDDCCKLK